MKRHQIFSTKKYFFINKKTGQNGLRGIANSCRRQFWNRQSTSRNLRQADDSQAARSDGIDRYQALDQALASPEIRRGDSKRIVSFASPRKRSERVRCRVRYNVGPLRSA